MADFTRTSPRPISLRTNASRQTTSLSFFSQHRPDDDNDAADGLRTVRVNNFAANLRKSFPSNELRTAKYTPLNMVPKSLFEQFKRVSNFYFLIVACVAYIPNVSSSLPITQALPLIVVVGFGFARDIYEDLKRASHDRKSNGKPEYILSRENHAASSDDATAKKVAKKKKASFPVPDDEALRMTASGLNPDYHVCVPSRGIVVGDIVLVRKGEIFPCDMVLLFSSGEGNVAYVSTANLDGESNLKRLLVAEATSTVDSINELRNCSSVIRAQQPSPILHEFEGKMSTLLDNFTPLDSSNLLLRGSILRNTEYVYGVAVYTGYDTKVALNMRHPPNKMGDIEKKLNWVVLLLFSFLAVIVLISAGISGFLQSRFGEGQWYMGDDIRFEPGWKLGVRSVGTFFILFYTVIPVSLFVTLEFVRLVQGMFMSFDPRMKSGDQAAVARSTNLNETLGTIQHVLSDKTGTLTENIMRYVACSAGGHIYDTTRRKSVMAKAVQKNIMEVRRLVWAMALCHSVVPEPKSDPIVEVAPTQMKEPGKRQRLRRRLHGKQQASTDIIDISDPNVNIMSAPGVGPANDAGIEMEVLPDYQGQSPDEVALVTVARDYGVALLRRSMKDLEIDHFGTTETYTVLAELEFNSDRKRMSMILECPDGKIRIITKGADTIMLNLLEEETDTSIIQAHVDHFATEGLRTLIFAMKTIPKREYETWFKDFVAARSSLEDRDKRVSEVSARIEQDLEFIAVTAVEDKLQDRVPETIKFLREADVRLWVLTGDKRETAENIGYSANLLDRQMTVFHIKASNSEQCREQILEALEKHCEFTPSDRTLQESSSSTSLSIGETKVRHGEMDRELGVIIDGASLKYAIEDLAEEFMQLADYAKTVICCRVTPLQKALVVRMVRELRKSTTLAIGDGGNDVSMIQEAHVGVGIFGKEGTQAARSGDYAIGEFKHLRQLVAVHGRYSQIRTAGLINLSFYKNFTFTLTQVYFQIFCFASGTTFNNQWLASAFNVLVTSGPPFVFGIFEKDLDESTLFRFPRAYAAARDRGCFSIRSVAEYAFLYGGWHSVVIFFGVLLCFGSMKINHANGLDSGFDLVGFVVTTLIVCMTLFKFILHTYIQGLVFIIVIVLSFLMYLVLVPLCVYFPPVNEQALNGLYPMMLGSTNFWVTAILVFVVGYYVDYLALMVRRLVFPDTTYALQRWEQQQRRQVKENE